MLLNQDSNGKFTIEQYIHMQTYIHTYTYTYIHIYILKQVGLGMLLNQDSNGKFTIEQLVPEFAATKTGQIQVCLSSLSVCLLCLSVCYVCLSIMFVRPSGCPSVCLCVYRCPCMHTSTHTSHTYIVCVYVCVCVWICVCVGMYVYVKMFLTDSVSLFGRFSDWRRGDLDRWKQTFEPQRGEWQKHT